MFRRFWSLFSIPEEIGYLTVNDSNSHDLNILTKTKTSSKWWSIRVCPICKAKISFEETMTDICLTCGKKWRLLSNTYGACRDILWRGEWIKQLHYENENYQMFSGKPSISLKG